MRYTSGLTITTILMLVMFAGFSSQVSAQAPQFELLPEELTVNVCREFTVTVEIEINDPADPMVEFLIDLEFDPNSMEYVSHTINAFPGWTDLTVNLLDVEFGVISVYTTSRQPPVDVTRDWVTIVFHCLEEGDTLITLSGIITLQSDASFIDVDSMDVHQIEGTVGGVASPINKLEILIPYIALAGLIVAVSTVYVIKKRRE